MQHEWIKFKIDKINDTFNKIFKKFPCKDHTLKGVLHYYWIFNQYLTKVNNDVKHFWSFINDLSDICLVMERELIIIDKTRAYNDKLLKDPVFTKNVKAKHYIASINTALFYDKCLSLIIKMSALFDNYFSDKTINERTNFVTYLNDFDQKGNNINIRGNIQEFNINFIKPLDKYVAKHLRKFFNTYKHNIKGDELIDVKLEFQEVFDIWYILENFIRPILLVLFRAPSKCGNEYILIRHIDFSFPIEDIYDSIIKGTK